ncbi:Alpha/beta hydrolase family protein [Thermomonospora echinospora]|uniref:Alpha/beta hydrolase family protein n=1 Tax=Thermomonospora echinospora TaxID=1992 RepID=A0A1H6DMF3_9ACTN|nr:alpha/beta hydrolase [Thermomonospora echinospora]SEG86389.1 Alpha/beta hydrolase family protein [Thermomonospora echinospora]
MFRRLAAAVAAVLLVSTMVAGAAQAAPPQRHRPVIFVHGFSGSGAQFETQARRLASNGYPADLIEAHEYDSLFAENTREEVYAGLDARIARLRAKAGTDKVDLFAHSLGTTLMQAYLRSSPARAATVAHYVNLDGASSADQPGGVPTLAIWGEGPTTRAVGGARNVYLSDQAHTQTVTSPETFTEAYRFLTGQSPRTTAIVPQPPGHTRLSGRAVLFPANVGAEGASLEVYRVDPRTGQRKTRKPEATFKIAGDGSWGPFKANGSAYYEFAVVWGNVSTHHLYFQPFLRSDNFVRLLTSRPGEGLASQVETGDHHSALTINRQKEWWGDQGAAGDSLRINGQEVLNAANTPRTKRAIGIFAYDAGVDGVTDLTAPIPVFAAQPFITGIDFFMPASTKSSISLVSQQRGGGGRTDTLTVPAWPSSQDRISVQFNDHLQASQG